MEKNSAIQMSIVFQQTVWTIDFVGPQSSQISIFQQKKTNGISEAKLWESTRKHCYIRDLFWKHTGVWCFNPFQNTLQNLEKPVFRRKKTLVTQLWIEMVRITR